MPPNMRWLPMVVEIWGTTLRADSGCVERVWLTLSHSRAESVFRLSQPLRYTFFPFPWVVVRRGSVLDILDYINQSLGVSYDTPISTWRTQIPGGIPHRIINASEFLASTLSLCRRSVCRPLAGSSALPPDPKSSQRL